MSSQLKGNYELNQCVIYKLKSKRKLKKLLNLSENSNLKIYFNDDYFSCFDLMQEDGSARNIQTPINELQQIHIRLANFFKYVKTPDYLHSGKKKHSIVTNAKAHIDSSKPTLTIDIAKFFPSTKREKIFNFFYKKMHQSADVADILSRLVCYNNHVPTGSSISMLIAFWANKEMFDELYKLCEANNIIMTVYVDDISFTGNGVDKLFLKKVTEIIERYGLNIKKEKVKFFKANSPKTITGVIVKNNRIYARNEHYKKLRVMESAYKITKVEDVIEKGIMQKAYNGQLAFLVQIHPQLRNKMVF